MYTTSFPLRKKSHIRGTSENNKDVFHAPEIYTVINKKCDLSMGIQLFWALDKTCAQIHRILKSAMKKRVILYSLSVFLT